MNKIELLKQKIKENEEQLKQEQHILSYKSLIAINHQLRDELVDELESENMLLKTKLAMYQEIAKEQKEFIENLAKIFNFHYLDINIQELEKQIASLDKKCDGECEI